MVADTHPPMPPPDLARIIVSDDIYIEYDREDTWFVIADKDNLGYDEMGAVVLGSDEIDGLIKALQELKEVAKVYVCPFDCPDCKGKGYAFCARCPKCVRDWGLSWQP
jgi:hypothetical protein